MKFLITGSLLLSLFSFSVFAEVKTPIKLGISFPPYNSTEKVLFTVEKLKELQINHIRFSYNFKHHDINPNFWGLKERLKYFQKAGIKVLLTVESDHHADYCVVEVAYACLFNEEGKRRFGTEVSRLVEEVGDYVDALQFGNEWDNRKVFFPGTPEQFLEIHKIFVASVRSVRPRLPIVLGGITGGIVTARRLYEMGACRNRYVNFNQSFGISGDSKLIRETLCNENKITNVLSRYEAIKKVVERAQYDVLDVHLYDTPTQWFGTVERLKSWSAKPFVVSEFGGPNPKWEPQGEFYQSLMIPRYLAAIAKLPIKRAYYFKLTDDPYSFHKYSGLFSVEMVGSQIITRKKLSHGAFMFSTMIHRSFGSFE